MSPIIEYMTTQGVPELSLVFFLMLPVVATVISFSRQVVGIKAFGLYVPLIITFAFLATGIKYGIIIFLLTLIVGTVMRFILRKIRLLYLPRMALTLIMITISIYVLFLIAIYLDKISFVQVAVFPVLILVILSEKFIATQIHRDNRVAIILTLETLILAIACYYLITWSSFQQFALNYPLIIIGGSIVINLLLGRWTGLRLTEYFRFKEVAKQIKKTKK